MQGKLTDEQQTEYQTIIDKIRYLLPDINIELDKQTGLLVGGADALLSQADAWKKVALQQALATKYKDQMEAWGAAAAELSENQTKLNRAQADGRALSERYAAVQKQMTDNYEEPGAWA